MLKGTFLFKPATTSLGDSSCQFVVQVVNVIDGFTDLHVEHRRAGPGLELLHRKMLEELRQLGTTRVGTSHRTTRPCLAMYQMFPKHYTTSASLKPGDATELFGESKESLLCFTLTGKSTWTRGRQPVKLTEMLAFLIDLQVCREQVIHPTRPWKAC